MENRKWCTWPAMTWVGLVILAAVIGVVTPLAFSQEVSASITGLVTDPSGAAIANANVTARDLDRGTVYPTQTNVAGIFLYPRIPAGRYELKVEAAGFKTLTRTDLTLEVNQRARLDMSMEVGAVAESVEVTG